MKTHKPGPIPRASDSTGQNEDGEFAFLVVGDAEAVASWRKLSGRDAEPPFARKPAAVEETQTHSASRHGGG